MIVGANEKRPYLVRKPSFGHVSCRQLYCRIECFVCDGDTMVELILYSEPYRGYRKIGVSKE